MDIAANFKYDFVTVDAYLNTAKATAKADNAVALEYIKEYEVPGLPTKVSNIYTLAKRLVLGAKVSVENTTLIPGATLKLAWEGKDLTNKVSSAVTKGTVAVSCTIKF